MFGGRSFMVNDKMIVSAMKTGDLLVRVDAQRHEELVRRPGAATGEMGMSRSMGVGWIAVSAEAITGDEALKLWLDAALDYNRMAASKAR